MTNTSDIHWRPWSAAAFEEAKKADKPILLRLSAVWCHWCHVMDQTSDKDPEAIRLLNERYVPIRVEIDQFPDVRERYNFGGFPTSAFLTPEGEILTGGTYIPPAEFTRLLSTVETSYRSNMADIVQRVREIEVHERTHTTEKQPPKDVKPQVAANRVLEAAVQSLLVNFDAENGGFGAAPKFPHSSALELALRLYQDSGDKEYATVVRKTLDAMRAGDIWDREEKAFFRYATLANWAEPHYEKMLEGNAGLLSNYVAAAAVFSHPEWARVAADQRVYLGRTLQDAETGLFYGSQDADEEYYALPRDRRSARTAPYVDRTFYADWNAMMILGYLDAFLATGDVSWRTEALKAVDGLWRLHRAPQGGLYHYSKPGGMPERAGLFADQAYATLALLRAHELGGKREHLDRAREIFDHARRTMWDEDGGRFLDREMTGEELGRVARKQSSIVENGIALRCLVRLHHFTQDDSYAKDARTVLASHQSQVDRWGIFASELALGALELQRGPLVVHLIPDGPSLSPFLEEAHRIAHPFVMVRVLEGAEAADAARLQGLTGVRAPAAFVCAGTACSRLYKPGEPFAKDTARLTKAVPSGSD